MREPRIILTVSVVAIAIAAAAYWFMVQQPAQYEEATRKEQALLKSGLQLYQEKDFQKALQVFQRIPGDSAHAAQARYYQGNAHIMLKDYSSAAEQLEQSLLLNSDDVDTLFALGVAYFKLGKLQLSRGYFTAVLEFSPENDQEQTRMEEALGLIEIIARLERQQPGFRYGEEKPDTGN